MTRWLILMVAVAVYACSSTTTTNGPPPGDLPGVDGGTSSGGSSDPCGQGGIYGTYHIKGTLSGTESICGLSLGSFDGGTLVIAQGSSSGATVTVTGSGAGHIDVSDCAATVSGCKVTAPGCSGSKDTTASVGLDLSVTSPTIEGTSQLRYGGCQAPGLPFTGAR
jgi:hypothetical protein